MQASLSERTCHTAASVVHPPHVSTQWPSQRCRLRPVSFCIVQTQQQPSPRKQRRSTCCAAEQQQSACAAVWQLNGGCVLPERSISRPLGSPHNQQQRPAVLAHSISNGRGGDSRSVTRQPATLNLSDKRRAYNGQQQQQQQPGPVQQQQQQQQPPSSTPGSKYARPAAGPAGSWQGQQQQWQQQQQQNGYSGGMYGDLIVPRQRFVLRSYNKHIGAWYKDPAYSDPSNLHAAIMQRSGTGSFEAEALKHLLAIAATPRDAQLALSAVTAVRAVAVSQGMMTPWPDSFVKTFVRMCAECESHEVLLSAMQRPVELGFVFKWKSLLVPLKHWGDQCAVDKLEQIAYVMEDAGLRPDERMAYIIVRACVNSGQWDRIDRVLAWFSSKGIHREEFRPAFVRLLEKAEAVKSAAGNGAAAVAAAQEAAAAEGLSSQSIDASMENP